MNVLIVGGAGFLGTALTKSYIGQGHAVTVYSRDEMKLWKLRNGLKRNVLLSTVVGDANNAVKFNRVLQDLDPDVIILAQALKQIDVCEQFPEESINTNILSTKTVLDCIANHKHKKFTPPVVLFVSTDKAVDPFNTYGACKLVAERLMTTAADKDFEHKYVIVRYGNVLSSTGSIVPLLVNQAIDSKQKWFTITDPNMTRFILTLEEAVTTIHSAVHDGRSGETWIPIIKAMRLRHLAEYFENKYSKPFKIVGTRRGEKKHEILMSQQESLFSREITSTSLKKYIVLNQTQTTREMKTYSSSDNTMQKKDLFTLLDKNLEWIKE